MAKFTGKDMILTIGGNDITGLVSVNTSEAIDVYLVNVAAVADKVTVTGHKEASLAVNVLPETDDVTMLGYFDPGDSGAIVFKPVGAVSGSIQIDSTNGTVVSRDGPVSVDGLTAWSFNINLDDFAISVHI